VVAVVSVVSMLALLALLPTVMLLHFVLDDAAHNGTTDCSENAVVGLVARESSSESSGECSAKTTFTALSFTGRTLSLATELSA
jgi:hypothetical protein